MASVHTATRPIIGGGADERGHAGGVASVHTATPPIIGGGADERGHAGRGCKGVGEGGTMGTGNLQWRRGCHIINHYGQLLLLQYK